VTGVDFAPRAISLARRKLKKAGLQADLQIKDVTMLDGIEGPYDLAFDLGCYHGIFEDLRARYLAQLHRILAPGGFWLMYGGLKSEEDRESSGLTEAEIDVISSKLSCLSRRDGTDSSRGWSSAWFLFQKMESFP
jgi:SAM-dependent methyltransferase